MGNTTSLAGTGPTSLSTNGATAPSPRRFVRCRNLDETQHGVSTIDYTRNNVNGRLFPVPLTRFAKSLAHLCLTLYFLSASSRVGHEVLSPMLDGDLTATAATPQDGGASSREGPR